MKIEELMTSNFGPQLLGAIAADLLAEINALKDECAELRKGLEKITALSASKITAAKTLDETAAGIAEKMKDVPVIASKEL